MTSAVSERRINAEAGDRKDAVPKAKPKKGEIFGRSFRLFERRSNDVEGIPNIITLVQDFYKTHNKKLQQAIKFPGLIEKTNTIQKIINLMDKILKKRADHEPDREVFICEKLDDSKDAQDVHCFYYHDSREHKIQVNAYYPLYLNHEAAGGIKEFVTALCVSAEFKTTIESGKKENILPRGRLAAKLRPLRKYREEDLEGFDREIAHQKALQEDPDISNICEIFDSAIYPAGSDKADHKKDAYDEVEKSTDDERYERVIYTELADYPMPTFKDELSLDKRRIAMHKVIPQLLKALVGIHRKGLIHGDLKPGNILLRNLEDQIRAMVADFGSTRRMHTCGEEESECPGKKERAHHQLPFTEEPTDLPAEGSLDKNSSVLTPKGSPGKGSFDLTSMGSIARGLPRKPSFDLTPRGSPGKGSPLDFLAALDSAIAPERERMHRRSSSGGSESGDSKVPSLRAIRKEAIEDNGCLGEKSIEGTPQYYPPERNTSNEYSFYSSQEGDVWAMGLIFHLMMRDFHHPWKTLQTNLRLMNQWRNKRIMASKIALQQSKQGLGNAQEIAQNKKTLSDYKKKLFDSTTPKNCKVLADTKNNELVAFLEFIDAEKMLNELKSTSRQQLEFLNEEVKQLQREAYDALKTLSSMVLKELQDAWKNKVHRGTKGKGIRTIDDLIDAMLDPHPKHRITAKQALEAFDRISASKKDDGKESDSNSSAKSKVDKKDPK